MLFRSWAARTRVSLADMQRNQRSWDAAKENVRTALQYFQSINDRPAEARALRELGMLFRERAQWDTARDYFTQSQRIFAELHDDLWVARALHGLARLQEMRGQDAQEIRQQVADICGRCDVPPDRQGVCLAEW